MVVVVLFVTLMLGLWGIATREIGAMLRIEQARARRVKRDMDALPAKKALARALAELEVGYPPSNSYPCGFQADSTLFAVTFERALTDEWNLSVSITDDTTLPALDPSQVEIWSGIRGEFTVHPPPF